VGICIVHSDRPITQSKDESIPTTKQRASTSGSKLNLIEHSERINKILFLHEVLNCRFLPATPCVKNIKNRVWKYIRAVKIKRLWLGGILNREIAIDLFAMVLVLYRLLFRQRFPSLIFFLPKFKLAESDTLVSTRIIQTVRFLPMIDVVFLCRPRVFLTYTV